MTDVTGSGPTSGSTGLDDDDADLIAAAAGGPSDVSGASLDEDRPFAPSAGGSTGSTPGSSSGASSGSFGASTGSSYGSDLSDLDDESEEDSVLVRGIDVAEAKAADLRYWADDQGSALRETILEHPITSCAATFGIGLVFGVLLARR